MLWSLILILAPAIMPESPNAQKTFEINCPLNSSILSLSIPENITKIDKAGGVVFSQKKIKDVSLDINFDESHFTAAARNNLSGNLDVISKKIPLDCLETIEIKSDRITVSRELIGESTDVKWYRTELICKKISPVKIEVTIKVWIKFNNLPPAWVNIFVRASLVKTERILREILNLRKPEAVIK